MIDTDKYEGHTPTPWRLDADIDYNCDLRVGFTASHDGYSIGTLHTDKPTSQLIADAPLLLAFYKRIKEIMDMDEIEEIERVELILQEMIE